MATNKETEDLNAQIEAIRADMQNLSSTVSSIASKQMNRAQNKAMETKQDAEEAIKSNPLQAVAIAAGLGFLFGVFTRR
ncbi:MAG: glycine zipper domain-containing protein [Methyloceanibacter sp.]|uniref:glycine zipper domain-containing protein n=1 Tax=Methyloceanibacter sp. TaxID=1965321 RepID=UPI003EE19190